MLRQRDALICRFTAEPNYPMDNFIVRRRAVDSKRFRLDNFAKFLSPARSQGLVIFSGFIGLVVV